MTLKKKLLIFVSAAVLLFAAAIVVLWTNLDWIARNAIERYGSLATGTAVRVESVSLEPADGTGAIRGLAVANPKGYKAPHVITLGAASIRIVPRTLASDPVVIDDIRITSPLIVYEMNDKRVANVDVLKKNLGADKPSKPASGKKDGNEKGKRLRIRHLVIEHAKAEVRIAGDDRTRTVSLPRIEMKDVGGRNGAPPEEVAQQIVNAVLSAVTKEVGKAGATRLLENALERALKRK